LQTGIIDLKQYFTFCNCSKPKTLKIIGYTLLSTHIDQAAAQCTAKSTFLLTNRQLSEILGHCFSLLLCQH